MASEEVGSGRERVEWVDDKTFEKGDLVVQVRKLPLKRPRFSLGMGSKNHQDPSRTNRFVPLFSHGQGTIQITSVSHDFWELLKDAEDYVQGQLQAAEDAWVANRQTFEQRDIDRGKPKQRAGLSGGANSGKTEKKRRRHRENGGRRDD
jgi:hypothetical protein